MQTLVVSYRLSTARSPLHMPGPQCAGAAKAVVVALAGGAAAVHVPRPRTAAPG